MASYENTLKSYNPVLLLSSDGASNALEVGTTGLNGVVISEVGNIVAFPTQMTYGGTVENMIFNGPSLSSNELNGNNSFAFGSKSNLANDYFLTVDTSASDDFNNIGNLDATLTFQCMIPKQTFNSQIKAALSDNILVYDGETLLGAAEIINNRWKYSDIRILSNGHIADYNIRYSINGSSDSTIQDSRIINYGGGSETVTSPINIPSGFPPTEVSSPSIITAQIINTYYEEYGSPYKKYIAENGVRNISSDEPLFIEGIFNKRLVIYQYEEFPKQSEHITHDTENAVFTSNSLRVNMFTKTIYTPNSITPNYENYIRFLIGGYSILAPIVLGEKYNFVVTLHLNTLSGEMPIYEYHIYMNGKLYTSGTRIGIGNNLTSSHPIYIGNIPSMNVYSTNIADISTMRNYIYLDNISIHPYLLTPEQILTLHYTSLTYQSIISYNQPQYNFLFNSIPLGMTFNSTLGGGVTFGLANRNLSVEYNDNSITPVLLNFSNKNQLLSGQVVSLGSQFCFIIWLKVRSDGVIYSSRNYVSPFQGLTVFVENGRVFLESGSTVIDTTYVISDDKLHMLVIQRESNVLRVVVDNIFNRTFSIPSTLNSSSNVQYTSLMCDIGGIEHIDASIGSFTSFNHAIDLTTLNNFFNINVLFSINGTITLENLPILTEVRIYDHYTGNLIGKSYTDFYGNFSFSNSYMREVDVMVMDYATKKGVIQVLGPILPLSN